jgi:hypothetical protein
VSSILTLQPNPSWEATRPHFTEPDQADASDRCVADQLRAERLWEYMSDCLGIDAVVHKQPTLDSTLKTR